MTPQYEQEIEKIIAYLKTRHVPSARLALTAIESLRDEWRQSIERTELTRQSLENYAVCCLDCMEGADADEFLQWEAKYCAAIDIAELLGFSEVQILPEAMKEGFDANQI